MAPLAPFTPPLGPQPPNPHYYSPTQTTLHMKEKVFSLSGDDFTVKTAEGMEVCRCKGKVLSVRDKKQFTDVNGKLIFSLGNKMLSIHKSFHAESKEGYDFEVKGHFKLIGSASSVEFKNAADGQKVELEVKGDWFDRSADIKWGGREVASISRSYFNVRQIFGDKQSVCCICGQLEEMMLTWSCSTMLRWHPMSI